MTALPSCEHALPRPDEGGPAFVHRLTYGAAVFLVSLRGLLPPRREEAAFETAWRSGKALIAGEGV